MLSDATFRELLDSAPDGMLVIGPDGKIVVANAQMEELFGYSRDELIGERPEILVPDASRDAHTRYRAQYERHPATRAMASGLSLRGRRKNGTEFPVEISLSPRQTPEGTLIVAAVRDITDRLRMETERQSLLDAAHSQNERERIAMDLHDGIIQSIFGVGLGLEIAAEEAQGTAAEPLVEKAIDQLNDVIRDIRGYIFELRPMSYDGNLGDSLQHLAGAFRASSPILIELTIEPEVATGDTIGVVIFQIVQEALANVRKHSQAKHVSVTIVRPAESIAVSIMDDGVGFDAASERSEEHRGLRNLASRTHSVGGQLAIDSEIGKGTMISVSIPVT